LINHFGTFVFRGYGLGDTTLYLFHVLLYELNDAFVVLGVLVLQASTLKDFHCF